MRKSPAIPRIHLMRYGILAFPLAFAGMPLYIHAPDFYATQYGISLGTLGIILLAIRSFDAIQDPLIGTVSDRYASRRVEILMLGIILLGASFYMLFHPSPNHTTFWFAASMILATTAFSILSINLNALGGTWTINTHEKTRITSYREALGLIGLLLASLLPTLLQNRAEPPAAFHQLSIIFIALLGITALIFLSWMKTHQELRSRKKQLFLRSFSKQHRKFFTIYIISMLASAIPAVLVIFFIRDRLEAETYTGLFLLLYFLSGVLGMPLWQKLSKTHGKLRAWTMSMVLAIITFIWAFFLSAGDIWQYAAICIASGLALGAELALPPSILADLLEENKSLNNASGHFSVLTFLAKAALALASATTFLTLDKVGYQPGQENSENALYWLSVSYALIPCLIKCISAFLLYQLMRSFNQGGKYVPLNSHNRSRINA